VTEHDLIIIGAGPGGYVAAIRAAQLGFNVACIEKEAVLGGTCVRVGCIPSKALLESTALYAQTSGLLQEHGVHVEGVSFDLARMQERKEQVIRSNTDGVEYLFKKNGITRYRGSGEISGPGRVTVHGEDGEQHLGARHIIIATGSSVMTLPGVTPDGKLIGTSTEALEYDTVPDHLVVIGAGYIGLELGSVWRRLGAKVTVVEYQDRILPGMDAATAREALREFQKQGIEFQLGAEVKTAESDGEQVTVTLADGSSLTCDRLLLAVGRKPNTDGLNLEAAGVRRDQAGRIEVDDGYQTSVPGIYAIGDVIRGPMLAHKASEEGVILVEQLAGQKPRLNYDTIPGIVYTDPEVATVGQSEEQLKEAGIPYRTGSFPYLANGRARAMGRTDGKVRILAHAETDRVLGVHIIGAHAGDLISEAVSAITFAASSEDVAMTIHAHPTLSEIVREAALDLHGRALHM
jgi:dihydrolipoamide dehydrogenase